jgi:hypothetical protein
VVGAAARLAAGRRTDVNIGHAHGLTSVGRADGTTLGTVAHRARDPAARRVVDRHAAAGRDAPRTDAGRDLALVTTAAGRAAVPEAADGEVPPVDDQPNRTVVGWPRPTEPNTSPSA